MCRKLLQAALVVLFAFESHAQSKISTYAGPGLPRLNSAALVESIDAPYSIIPDLAGGFYISSFSQNRVYRVSVGGLIDVIVGSSHGYGGDGGPATAAQFNGIFGIALDRNGNLFIADMNNHRVRRVSTLGIVETVAGNGTPGFSGDGGTATAAQLQYPAGIAVDSGGNVYIADRGNNRVRLIYTDGRITTLAGTGIAGSGGDGGSPTLAQLNEPMGVAVDRSGNLFISEYAGHRVRRITGAATISTIVGTGIAGAAGDGGLGSFAQLNRPAALTVDNGNFLYIADSGNHKIRRISTATNLVTLVAGTGVAGTAGDGGPAIEAELNSPWGLAIDLADNLYVADTQNNRLRLIAGGVIRAIFGNGTRGFAGDGGIAPAAQMNAPRGVAMDQSGNLYIADTDNHRLRKIARLGIIAPIPAILAGSLTAGTGPVTFTVTWPSFSASSGARFLAGDEINIDGETLLIQAAGSLDPSNSQSITASRALRGTASAAHSNGTNVGFTYSSGSVTTFAGSGIAGFQGEGLAATLAQLNRPHGVAVDSTAAIYVADTFNHRIRKLEGGVMTTFAGFGTPGFAGDGGTAIYAYFNQPRAVAVDQSGNVYVADTLNHRIRMIDPSRRVSTIAGTGTAGGAGDGGPATAAGLNMPSGLAIDSAGNIYVADTGNRRIRRISVNGTISTVAGTSGAPIPGTNGDGFGAVALTAYLNSPVGVAIDSKGTLFISDAEGARIRIVPADGIIRTAAGVGFPGYSGDGGAATSAQLSGPAGLTIATNGDLYIADAGNHRIRRVEAPVLTIEGQVVTVSNRGGISLSTLSLGSSPVVGYGQILSTDPAVAGLAIFSYRQGNVLISEAAVPATRTLTSGRIYANVGAEIVGNRPASFANTGVAIANPNDSQAAVSFYFSGSSSASGSFIIGPRQQISSFLDQAPFNVGASFDGTLTFNSSVPVAITALRGLTNQRGEFLVTTLPVAELKSSTGSVFIPHFADGGGWATQIVVINPTDTIIGGTIQFLDQSGAPIALTGNNVSASSFSYSLSARGAYRLTTSGMPQSATVGSVRIVPAASAPSPTALAIFSYYLGGITLTEAGVPSVTAGTSFRMYVEAAGNSGAPGSVQSGIAVANLSGADALITLTVDRLDGTPTGLTGTVSVPANGQAAAFLNQISGFSGLPAAFQGVLRVTSSASISIVGLRGRYNERSDFLITTTPPVNETALLPYGELFFPHFVDSGGYTTQFVILGGSSSQANVVLKLVSQAGLTSTFPLR